MTTSSAPLGGGTPTSDTGYPTPFNRAMITLAVVSAAFISIMDASVVNVVMPHMRGSFNVDLSTITWVATIYTIAQIITITMSAWWSTYLGRKRFFLISFVIFTLASILVGTSQTFAQMLTYRILQGLGGGGLIPVAQAILRESYPPNKQGWAMAMFAAGVVLAPAMGPVVGGWLAETLSWPWVFYINVPVAVVGITLVSTYVFDPPHMKRGINKVDWMGIILIGVGLTALQVVLERGQDEDWFESGLIILMTIFTIISLTALVLWELRTEEPIVDFRVLKNLNLGSSCFVVLIFGIVMFGTTFILPQFLQNLLDHSPYETGLVMLPRGIALFCMMPIVGHLYNLVDYRILMCGGVALAMTSLFLMSGLSLQTDYWDMVSRLVILGFGMPFVFVTLTTVAFSTTAATDINSATSLYNLARRLGGNLGFAVMAILLERRTALHRTNMVGHITESNTTFLHYKETLSEMLVRKQIDPHTAQIKAMALIEQTIDKQSTMLAYNDIYWIMGWSFIFVIPFILVLKTKQV